MEPLAISPTFDLNSIVNALKAHDGNRTKADEQLGISRRTLHRKLNEYGLRGNDGRA